MSQNSKLYVGNLNFKTTDEGLAAAFRPFGNVVRATVVMDRETGRARGFGFVEMGSDEEAQSAIDAMNGAMLDGRAIQVNVARPREDRGPRGGGGGGFGGGGYGGDRGGGGRRDRY